MIRRQLQAHDTVDTAANTVIHAVIIIIITAHFCFVAAMQQHSASRFVCS